MRILSVNNFQVQNHNQREKDINFSASSISKKTFKLIQQKGLNTENLSGICFISEGLKRIPILSAEEMALLKNGNRQQISRLLKEANNNPIDSFITSIL